MSPPFRYFEDFQVGQTFELGSHTVTREEIIAFGRQFDPQPFHVDDEAAAGTVFGGLIASGWHTASIFMRCYADGLLLHSASQGSPGVDEVRWRVPVRPDDVLRATATVVAAEPSRRHSERGTVSLDSRLTNQHDQVVFTMIGRGLFGRRPAQA